jgi:predicted RNase H-like nuclease (RuvC/YqgF family)
MMKKEDFKKLADDLFAEYPNEKTVHITSDGQSFFIESDAINHKNRRGLEVYPFHKGGAPVDEDLEEVLQEYQENERAYQESERKVSAIARMEEDVELGDDEEKVVLEVAKLREAYEESERNLKEAMDENKKLSDDLESSGKEMEALTTKLATAEKQVDSLKKEVAKLKKEAK